MKVYVVMDVCRKTVFYFGTNIRLWTFFFLLIFYIFLMSTFLPNIRNKAAANRLSFRFITINVRTTPQPIVRLGDRHERISPR